MKEGPLSEKELQWLEDMLEKYGSEESILDVSELDGLLTAVLSGPTTVEPSKWGWWHCGVARSRSQSGATNAK